MADASFTDELYLEALDEHITPLIRQLALLPSESRQALISELVPLVYSAVSKEIEAGDKQFAIAVIKDLALTLEQLRKLSE